MYGESRPTDHQLPDIETDEGDLAHVNAFSDPTRDYQCACRKKQSGNKGRRSAKVRDRDKARIKGRQERIRYIRLEAPVIHTLVLEELPLKAGILLGIRLALREEIVYHASYIVTDGFSPLAKEARSYQT